MRKVRFNMLFANALDRNLKGVVDDATRDRILEGGERMKGKIQPEVRAAWVRQVVERLDQALPPDVVAGVRERCACSLTPARLETMRRLRREHPDLDDFFAAVRANGIMGKGPVQMADGVHVFYGVGHCVCGAVRHTTEPIPVSYCHCGKGHVKALFEAAMGQPVRMEVVRTCLSGSDDCEFVAHLD